MIGVRCKICIRQLGDSIFREPVVARPAVVASIISEVASEHWPFPIVELISYILLTRQPYAQLAYLPTLVASKQKKNVKDLHNSCRFLSTMFPYVNSIGST
ncbi:unnamed protein product [Chondrus crispus]|uniref:Uncharacterized protein n=1 Tax=Chondrus crispus TaxID=2769 RepID=R7QH01_CHOCR|nr:unnamed protein product [Chondrus crispus]CDF37003.1 unnamed protein product [Chondrus crispus]|eukprot:XP_005716822.1 unnamed protein product [Chondrus crispus]